MPQSLNRRQLFGAAAAVGAAATLAAPGPAAAGPGANPHRVPRDRISVQLYTLRDQLGLDLEDSLTQLAEIGYTRVEHAGFVGRTAAQFRAALDNAGLRATSGHVGIPQPFDAATWQRALEDATIVGNHFIVHPFFGQGAAGPIRDAAVYQAFAHDLNQAGELARRAGLDFGYHNHQAEFLRQNGTSRTGFDILTGETDPRLVHLEVDLFWAFRGAHDPVDLIKSLAGRIKQVHVKDLDVGGGFADPGAGLIDFGRIFRQACEAGLVEYIVERDDAGTPPREPADALTTARVGYAYLADLRF
jgi:sugar phosphate isomerase/epimerase